MKCPKCGLEKDRLLAKSRFSDDMICSRCGSKESIEVLYINGVISEDRYHHVCDELDTLYEKEKLD